MGNRLLVVAAFVLVGATGCAAQSSGSAGGPPSESAAAATSTPRLTGSVSVPSVSVPSASVSSTGASAGTTVRGPAAVPSEGTLPPMPSSGVRGTETDDPLGVYAAQEVLDRYADEVRNAAGVVPGGGGGMETNSPGVPGFCEVGIDGQRDGVLVWWKGTPPQVVLDVLAKAKTNGVTPRVIVTRFDQRDLRPAIAAVLPLMNGKGNLTTLSINPDCSGITVGLKALTDADEAKVRAVLPDASIPVRFEVANPVAL